MVMAADLALVVESSGGADGKKQEAGNVDGGVEVILRKQWNVYDTVTYEIKYVCTGYFLFGFIPLYVKRDLPFV